MKSAQAAPELKTAPKPTRASVNISLPCGGQPPSAVRCRAELAGLIASVRRWDQLLLTVKLTFVL